MRRRIRLLIIAAISFLAVTNGTLFKKIISIFLCGVINLNSSACYAFLSDRSQANASLPPTSANSAIEATEDRVEGEAQLPNPLAELSQVVAEIPRVRQQTQPTSSESSPANSGAVQQVSPVPSQSQPAVTPVVPLNQEGFSSSKPSAASNTIGIDRWWATVGQGSIPVTLTVPVPAPGTYTFSVADENPAIGWSVRLGTTVEILDTGFTNKLNVALDPDGDTFLPELVTQLKFQKAGTYKVKIHSLNVPTQPTIEGFTFKLDGHTKELKALFVADHNESQIPDNYDVRVDKSPIKSFHKNELINYFAPVLYFNKGEIYTPLDVKSTTWLAPRKSKNPGSGEGDSNQFLNISQNPINNASKKVYASILTKDDELAINYYFHYQWSDWKEHGGFNNHAGDWEGITVFLRKGSNSQGRSFWYPCKVAYSQHVLFSQPLPKNSRYVIVNGGQVREWKELLDQKMIVLGKGGQRPKVWVGLGGHASYPDQDSTLVHNLCVNRQQFIRKLLQGIQSLSIPSVSLNPLCTEQHQGSGSKVENFDVEYLPRISSTAAPEWLRFPGTWGDPERACSTALPRNIGCPSAPRGPAFLDAELVVVGSSSTGQGNRWLNPWDWSKDFEGASQAQNCPPPEDDSPPAEIKKDGKQVKGTSYGDPHLITFDGYKYSFQTVGEFVLAKSTDGFFEVQTRQSPVNRSLSLNSAVAMRVGNNRVALYSKDFPDSDTNTPLRVNGKPTVVQGDSLSLPGGGIIHKKNDSNYVVEWSTGEKVTVRIYSRGQFKYMDVFPFVFESQAGQIAGLLGNVNGDANDDLRFRSGDVLPSKSTYGDVRQLIDRVSPIRLPLGQLEKLYFDKLNKEFGNSWRVSKQESLFDYAAGKSTETFADKSFPDAYLTLDMLSPTQLQEARAQCLNAGVEASLLDGCIFDVGFTGYSEFASRAAQVSNILDIVESVIPGFENPIPEIIRRIPKIPGLPF